MRQTNTEHRLILDSSEQQTLFLQNMLKNATQTPMVGTALSGTISSATAQGYLPQYRGSAAASLAPAMLNHVTVDRDPEGSQAAAEIIKEPIGGLSILPAQVILPENRPLNTDRIQALSSLGGDTMRAENYMRYLAQKDKKALSAELPAAGHLR